MRSATSPRLSRLSVPGSLISELDQLSQPAQDSLGLLGLAEERFDCLLHDTGRLGRTLRGALAEFLVQYHRVVPELAQDVVDPVVHLEGAVGQLARALAERDDGGLLLLVDWPLGRLD